jgi:hypothetical protein
LCDAEIARGLPKLVGASSRRPARASAQGTSTSFPFAAELSNSS